MKYSYFALIGLDALRMRNQYGDDASEHVYKWYTIDARMRLNFINIIIFRWNIIFFFIKKTNWYLVTATTKKLDKNKILDIMNGERKKKKRYNFITVHKITKRLIVHLRSWAETIPRFHTKDITLFISSFFLFFLKCINILNNLMEHKLAVHDATHGTALHCKKL